MVLEGKTPEEVAIALDHSTTASVQHYFKYNRDLIDFIDDSFESSKVMDNAVARWQGYVIDEDDNTVAGTLVRGKDLLNLGKCMKKGRCEWHPSVSCYGCGKFRPFKNANHAAQLEIIKAEFTSDPDVRDYIVSSEKFYSTGFKCHYDLDNGIEQLIKAYAIIDSPWFANY